jgi:hypothetical protein
MYTSVMWLENHPDYIGRVYVMDIDLEAGRVTLYGETGLTQEFNQKLEEMVLSVHDPMEWVFS